MAMKARMKGGARNTITSLQVMVKATEPQWTTPQAHDTSPRGAGQVPSAKAGNRCLARDAQQWATPTPPNGGRGMPEGTSATGTMPDGRKRTVGLENQVKASLWPTPASRDHKGENSADHLTVATGRKHMDQLPNAVAHGFTRPAQPRQSDGPTFLERLRTSRQLRAYLIASHGRASWRRLWKARKARRLNPGFVEWLMAWPEGHALCAGSAMAFTHWQQDMRGALSRLPTASGPWIWTPP